MKKVAILGAGGQIARWVVEELADRTDVQTTLFLRRATRLEGVRRGNTTVVQGDALKLDQLAEAVAGQDIVYANLTGEDIDRQAVQIVQAMKAAGVARLIFVASLGIYDEVPGPFGAWNRRQIGAYLPPFRRAADVIEGSGLDYTILRPAWLSDEDEVDYEMTGRNEPFKGTEVSRKSVAALILKIIETPIFASRANLGVNKPGTDAEKPSFM